ncbi:protein insensitive-like [Eupeodes corollae]|uniref:protein insensitive-like n=1 Tax=Eupeodes corollae TaxID=290404 RepID=UPI0024924004|nr:protein insensitive-like [Eupeodes corollae]
METPLPVNYSSSRPIQYYQYNIPMSSENQSDQQINIQKLIKNDHGYFQNQSKQEKEIYQPHYVDEKPMMLNAWSQTTSDDFPKLSCGSNKEVEMELLARIRDLESTLRSQNDIISHLQNQTTRTPSPRQDVPNSTTSTPLSSNSQEGTRYRILSQSIEVSNDSQILIEQVAPSPSLNNSNDSDRLEICMSDENDSNPERPDLENATVSIGPNGTQIPVHAYEKMTWTSPSLATRKLLSLVFDRETLATHSMTGKASPAFKDLDKPIKGKLDPSAVNDIIFIVSKKCGVSSKEIRSAITTKCADENKMCKLKALKKLEVSSNSTRSALKEILKNKSNRINDNGWMK